MATHERFLGEEIECALEIIGDEAEGVDAYELIDAYGTSEVELQLQIHGNYLHVEVDLEGLRDE